MTREQGLAILRMTRDWLTEAIKQMKAGQLPPQWCGAPLDATRIEEFRQMLADVEEEIGHVSNGEDSPEP